MPVEVPFWVECWWYGELGLVALTIVMMLLTPFFDR